MAESYALREGAFGRAVVLELRDDLVAHAHAETQFAFWLGGGRALAHLASEVVEYSEHVALGTNSYESHDARLLDKAQPAMFLVFYISKPWLDERRAASGRPFFFPTPRVPINAALRQACWRVLDIILSPHQDQSVRLEREVEDLIRTAIDATLAPVNQEGMRPRTPLLDHRLRAAIAYMREHMADPIAVEDVAGKVGLSRAHFFSLFRDQLNTTPQVFWSAVRVEEVVRRLVLREEPLTSVALELGFSSPGNFSRFFREHMGVSPSRFRRVAAVSESHPITGVS
ncbi:AraC family transcriptional regulator [Hydrogenophaga sp.]|uniref:AraC family transcriptional regulator n=1 Tax=Hydrogenophaga sp. TaxID=1904254 RepID=UPI00272F3EDE|nr:AraC family transcriptional regulator [Hydrogenophaga sp.]MDP2017340.1 AraC family transcriptional regulator [Hydrogenophaga sp.]MDP3168590.1 AraC family transcriptional regulator [Hydrogenophaga sp.]MDP3812567.1 AraC family transcriptional regulator [Hydrogenophaga sp.]